MSVKEWLRFVGIGLDERNTAIGQSQTQADLPPFFRTTGAIMMIDLEYTNIKKGSISEALEGKTSPEWDHRFVRTRVYPRVEKQWAGLAVKAPIYENIPQGDASGRQYRKLLRYSQGVVFQFAGKGHVYRFDFTAFVTLLTNALVMITTGVAASPSFHECPGLAPACDSRDLCACVCARTQPLPSPASLPSTFGPRERFVRVSSHLPSHLWPGAI